MMAGLEEPPLPRPAVDLLAVDLDGTLLTKAGKIPPRNREALHRAHEAGVKVVLCTGRSYSETRPVIEQLGLALDATVTVGGALITDVATGRTLHSSPMPREFADELLAWYQSREYTVLWLHDASTVGFDGYVVNGRNRHAAIQIWLDWSPCSMREAGAPPPDAPEPLRLAVVDNLAALRDVSRDLAAAFGERHTHHVIDVPAYRFTVVETFAPNVDKWQGILQLCERWGIDPTRTAAIGDDVNDLPMLRAAAVSAAPANAKPEALAAARLVVCENDEGAVADFCERVLR